MVGPLRMSGWCGVRGGLRVRGGAASGVGSAFGVVRRPGWCGVRGGLPVRGGAASDQSLALDGTPASDRTLAAGCFR